MKDSSRFLVVILLFCISIFGQTIDETKEIKMDTIDGLDLQRTINLDSIGFEKSAEMLDENLYWSIIENSKKATDNLEDQEVYLIAEIEKLNPAQMVGFRLRTDKLLYDTYTSPLWCAAYIINGGSSDDGFDYFRCWIISRGKEIFYTAQKNPDSLLKEVVKNEKNYEFESFWYVAVSAFKNVTNEELYAYIDYDNFVTNEENYPLIDFNWNIDEPKTMEMICPILYKNLWKK